MFIYKITNKINGRIYIGKTIHTVVLRWKRHIRDSKVGDNILFHNAIRKYGAAAFTVEQIDIASNEKELNEKEIYWIAFYKTNINRYPNNNGYNLTDGGEGVSGKIASEETRRKQSIAHKGRAPYVMTDEIRRNMSEAQKGKCGRLNNFYGRKQSDEVKEKVSKANKGKRIGAEHPRAQAVFCVELGKIFETTTAAERELNISNSNISRCCKGKCKTAGGYHWLYATLEKCEGQYKQYVK